MKSVAEIQKLLKVSKSKAKQIYDTITNDEDDYLLNYLPPSLTTSVTTTCNQSSDFSSYNSIQLLKRIMPWPFLFIRQG